jgi:hypothetical protein
LEESELLLQIGEGVILIFKEVINEFELGRFQEVHELLQFFLLGTATSFSGFDNAWILLAPVHNGKPIEHLLKNFLSLGSGFFHFL